MRGITTIMLALLLIAAGWSCTDEGKIFTAIQDGEELEEGTLVPFLLEQNYPNPFNPLTVIRFRIGEELKVRLEVFTEDWQPVQILLDRKWSVGRYEVQFNANDLPSGEYYYTMTGKGITQIRKMKLVK